MLVIAMGSASRSDDAAAFAVAERLRLNFQGRSDVDVVACDDVLSMLDRWTDEDLVVVIDAVRSGAPAGTTYCLDVTDAPLSTDCSFASSHEIGLNDAIELARTLDRLPSRLIVVGIEGERFAPGLSLSAAVAAAVPRAADLVTDTVRTFSAQRTRTGPG